VTRSARSTRSAPEPRFFARPEDFRAWLERHHEDAKELLVGFHRRDSGKPSLTWPESVDEALCFGWIDGVRKSLDQTSYTIRFSPRQASSTWSAKNTRRMSELIAAGRVRPAGIAAFERRDAARSGYSYEQRRGAALDEADERRFRADARAWAWFESQPPGYRRTAIWWVISAKREETRDRRLGLLIERSACGQRIGLLEPRPPEGR
jgi:uncharacterized protein YdeI (YjbR/CyaY-like superfamily)